MSFLGDNDGDGIPDFIEDMMGADLFRKQGVGSGKIIPDAIPEDMYDFKWNEIRLDELKLEDYFTIENVKYEVTDITTYKKDNIIYKRYDGIADNHGVWLKVDKDEIWFYKYIRYFPEEVREKIIYDNEEYELKEYGIYNKESNRRYDDGRDSWIDKTAECYFYTNKRGISLVLEVTDNFNDSSIGELITTMDIKAERATKTLKKQ